MVRKFREKIVFVLLSAFLAGIVAGCGTAEPGQGEAPSAAAGEEETGDVPGTGEGNNGMDAVGTESKSSGGDAGGNMSSAGDHARGIAAASADGTEAVTDFGLRLLQGCMEERAAFPPQASMPPEIYEQTGVGENILVSPLSVITALAMTANGAGGETNAQMEAVFGMPVTELSSYLSEYRKTLPEAEKYKLSMANGIWFTDDERFTVNQTFLQENETAFGAGIRRVPFDASAVREINGWVKENTDGMIEKILEEIPPDAVMYLVNALAFDAEWQEIYHDYQVREGEFTQEDGTLQPVEMMYSTESAYLEDENGEGFLKYYADRKYAFAALLPKEDMPLAEYIATMDGRKLRKILENPIKAEVDAAIPKYESEYGIEMSHVLQTLGMTDAFDIERADFSGIGASVNGNLYISRVLHKTFIAVDEQGTKAGAATAVEIRDECAIELPEAKIVHLDRPFLYMIIDCEKNLPVFLGVVETVE